MTSRFALQSDSKPNSMLSVGGVLGAVAGYGLSSYVGANMWIPALAGLLLALLFAKTPLAPPHFRGAIAVTSAHAIWMLVGAVYTGQWLPVGLDLVMMLAIILGVWLRPGRASAAALASLQLAALTYNVYLLLELELASPTHRAMTMHIVLRVLAIGLAIVGVRVLEQGPTPEPPPTEPPDPARLS